MARVWVFEGCGQITVNQKDWIDFFQPLQRAHIMEPFLASQTAGAYDVMCTVKGGGMSGQAGAVRLGISRALQAFSPDYRAPMKKMGLFTRDSRRVERKKPGQKKARKKFQWVKVGWPIFILFKKIYIFICFFVFSHFLFLSSSNTIVYVLHTFILLYVFSVECGVHGCCFLLSVFDVFSRYLHGFER